MSNEEQGAEQRERLQHAIERCLQAGSPAYAEIVAKELQRVQRQREQLGAAVRYVLERASDDENLGYHLGPHTQSFEQLVAALAAHEEPKDTVAFRKRFAESNGRVPEVVTLRNRVRELEAEIPEGGMI